MKSIKITANVYLIVIAFVLLGLSLIAWRFESKRVKAREQDTVLALSYDHAMAGIVARKPTSFTIKVRNPSSQVVKLLGISEFCIREGCIASSSKFPVAIAPFGESDLQLLLIAGQACDWEIKTVLLTDAPGQATIPIHVLAHVTELDRLDEPFQEYLP